MVTQYVAIADKLASAAKPVDLEGMMVIDGNRLCTERRYRRRLENCCWRAIEDTPRQCRGWINMACKQFPMNENYGALPISAYVSFRYDFGRRSSSITIRGMYKADTDKNIVHIRMTYHTPLLLYCTAIYFGLNYCDLYDDAL